MSLVWILLGMVLGFGMAYTRAYYIDQENERLRAALQDVRTMAIFGNSKSILRAVDRALEQEVAT